MSYRINSNIAGLQANMYGRSITEAMNKSMERISSGLRLNRASDGASDMTIANSLRAQYHGINQAVRNSNDGISMMNIADQALDEYSKILVEVRDKASSAVNDTMSDASRSSLADDINSLLKQADNIAKQTSYNGISLLDGTFSDKKIQTGAYAGQTTSITIANADIASLGVDSGNIDVTDSDKATATLTKIQDAISSLDKIRSGIGSTTINLESNVRNLSTTAVNIKAAESQIRDVDYATEQEELNKNSIKQQANAFALSKTFEAQSLVLNLLR